eukprot:CAMPEP_0170086610 /NCGR_PEP_ID=MMETSP0019_2-20121128/21242_1 /TAXON_ID=98059 /ORGANISM="Dinobryon sp., Strain UTEXLB2267" /LENGTH=180 /DNA_ID=CAMNT_0010303741 /DNA_START=568 /DNA_END=1107 /DNA_ORIENTATION=+
MYHHLVSRASSSPEGSEKEEEEEEVAEPSAPPPLQLPAGPPLSLSLLLCFSGDCQARGGEQQVRLGGVGGGAGSALRPASPDFCQPRRPPRLPCLNGGRGSSTSSDDGCTSVVLPPAPAAAAAVSVLRAVCAGPNRTFSGPPGPPGLAAAAGCAPTAALEAVLIVGDVCLLRTWWPGAVS